MLCDFFGLHSSVEECPSFCMNVLRPSLKRYMSQLRVSMIMKRNDERVTDDAVISSAMLLRSSFLWRGKTDRFLLNTEVQNIVGNVRVVWVFSSIILVAKFFRVHFSLFFSTSAHSHLRQWSRFVFTNARFLARLSRFDFCLHIFHSCLSFSCYRESPRSHS